MDDIGFHDVTAGIPEDVSTSSKGGGKREERIRYQNQVAKIHSALDAFRGAAYALKEIKTHRLYRYGGHARFETFCFEEFGFTPRTARRWIMAATVIGGIEDEGEEAPARECQTRQLGMLAEPAARARALGAARKASGSPQPTAKEVMKAVEEELAKGAKPTKAKPRATAKHLTLTLADRSTCDFRCSDKDPVGKGEIGRTVDILTESCVTRGMGRGRDGIAEMAKIQRVAVAVAEAINRGLRGTPSAGDYARIIANAAADGLAEEKSAGQSLHEILTHHGLPLPVYHGRG